MTLKESLVLFLSLTSLALLTVIDSKSIPFKIMQDKLTAKVGSCITLECLSTHSMETGAVRWFWMKNPIYDTSLSRFNGTIVSSNMRDRSAAPEFKERIKYIGQNYISYQRSVISCSLHISHLQKDDSGIYIFRYYIGNNKWKTDDLTLTVEDNLCPVSVETEKVQEEFGLVSLQCSTSKLCGSYPEITGLNREVKADHKDEVERKTTTLDFTASWQDDGRVLSCQPPGMKKEDQCLAKTVTLTVEYAPKETKAVVNSADVKVGDDISLTCSSRGHPNATFSWFKDQQPRHIGRGAQWTIRPIKAMDSGQYYCQAVNKLGSINSNKVTVDVKYAPVGVCVDTVYALSTIKKGDDVTLVCRVEKSNPTEISYEWYQDTIRKSGENSKQLQIISIKPEHRGNYMCKATNRVGLTTSPAYQLNVHYGPQNTEVLYSGYNRVKEGNSLIFSCKTDAYPSPMSYSWYHSDTRTSVESPSTLHQSSDQNLHLDKLGATDAGCYLCSATNNIGMGQNSSSLCIDVLYRPTTPVLTVIREVREGTPITITCTAQSFPPSQLTLSSTSKSLPTPHPQFTSGPVEQSIQISFNVTVSDAGTYACDARNSEGHSRAQKELNVTYSPKNVTAWAHPGTELPENDHLVLTCTGRSNPGVSSYTWIRTTTESTRIVGHDQKLEIKFLVLSDSGLYSCTAQNELGTGRSRQVHIKVKYAPKHTEILHNMSSRGQSDSPVALSCSSHSYPGIDTYKWYKLIEDKDQFVTENQNITVHPNQPGTYYCVAENIIASKASARVQLFFNSGYSHILPLTLLLVCAPFIILLIFLVWRYRRNKPVQQGTSETSSCCGRFGVLGRRNGMVEANRSREDLMSVARPLPQPARACPDSTSASNVHTVYSALKMPVRNQGHSPSHPITASGEPSQSDAVNYATLNFMNQEKSNHGRGSRATGSEECVYTKIVKAQPTEKGMVEDYENIKGGCRPQQPVETDSESSEEDVEYSQVTFKTKAGHHHPHKENYSSSDEEDYKT